jgi:hypothetical protein
MSDGLGSWTVKVGTWNINTNRAESTLSSVNYVVEDSAMSVVGDQKAEITSQGTDTGVICRTAAGSDSEGEGYIAIRQLGKVYLYKRVGTTLTQLAVSAGAMSDGDVLALECIGTFIDAKVNGSSVASATDSALSTGKAGMVHYPNLASGKFFENFNVYTDAGGGGLSIPVAMNSYRQRRA